MLLSTVAAGCIYGDCILLGCTSSLTCFCIGLFLVLSASQQILFFLFVWLALWVLCGLPTCMSLCLGLLLPVSLCVSNSLVLPLVCISDMYFLHLFYCLFLSTQNWWMVAALAVGVLQGFLRLLCGSRSYASMVGPLWSALTYGASSRLSYVCFCLSRIPIYVPVYPLLTALPWASLSSGLSWLVRTLSIA
jgi:hypothetical protein